MPNYEIAHSYETVTLLRDGSAARIELNRPERGVSAFAEKRTAQFLGR